MSNVSRISRTWLDKEVVKAIKELSRAEKALRATEHKVRKKIRERHMAMLENEGEVPARTSLSSLVKGLEEVEQIAWGEFVNRLQPMFPSQGRELKDALRKLKVTPNVCWYPISGLDFSPLALIEVYEFLNQKLLNLLSPFDDGESTLLWLSDAPSAQISDVIPQRVSVEYRSVSDASFKQFMDGHNLKDERISQVSLRAEKMESYLFNGIIPIHLFSVSRDYRDWDPYIVLFTNASSESLFRQVFYTLRIRIKSVFLGRNVPLNLRYYRCSADEFTKWRNDLRNQRFGLTADGQPRNKSQRKPEEVVIRLYDLLTDHILSESFDGIDRFRDIPKLLRKVEKTLGSVDYYFLDQQAFSQETLTPRLSPIKHYQHMANISGIGFSQIGVFSRPNAFSAPF